MRATVYLVDRAGLEKSQASGVHKNEIRFS